jgi:hypothetical protein
VPQPLTPGDRCDAYQIVASLGTSAAAEHYLARTASGDPCVLKIMAAPGADNASASRRAAVLRGLPE